MDKNIYLTGFMGVGKSSVARDLAEYLVWEFVDLDHEVELLGRQSINDITEADGLGAIRQLEEKALGQISLQKNRVIALGAGTLLNPESMGLVKNSGHLIYLCADLSTLLKRLIKDTSKERPILGSVVSEVQKGKPGAERDLEGKVSAVFQERLPTYLKADLKIDTDLKTPREITIEISKRLHHR